MDIEQAREFDERLRSPVDGNVVSQLVREDSDVVAPQEVPGGYRGSPLGELLDDPRRNGNGSRDPVLRLGDDGGDSELPSARFAPPLVGHVRPATGKGFDGFKLMTPYRALVDFSC